MRKDPLWEFSNFHTMYLFLFSLPSFTLSLSLYTSRPAKRGGPNLSKCCWYCQLLQSDSADNVVKNRSCQTHYVQEREWTGPSWRQAGHGKQSEQQSIHEGVDPLVYSLWTCGSTATYQAQKSDPFLLIMNTNNWKYKYFI